MSLKLLENMDRVMRVLELLSDNELKNTDCFLVLL
jgi:hypothetical protein